MSIRLCAFGDSITWGSDDIESSGWVGRLRDYFDRSEKHTEDNYVAVYNCGVSGDNSDDLLARFKAECVAREPAIILIDIGVNDSQYIETRDNPRVSIEKYTANLQQLAKEAKKFTDKIVFIGLTPVDETKTTPIPWDTTKHYDAKNVKRYDTALSTFCKDNDLLFVNVQDLIKLSDMEDGLHPNSEGHRKIYERVKAFLQEKGYII
jgi:lysophospholipase L1-like esterase